MAAEKAIMYVEKVTDRLRFCYLKLTCLWINITLIFMSSSSNEFMLYGRSYYLIKTDVSAGIRLPWLCLSKGHQPGIFIQSFINVGKTIVFLSISHIKNQINQILGETFGPPFPRVFTLIEWF